MNLQLVKAMRIAWGMHSGQWRRGGDPYLFHPYRISLKMDTDTERAVAWLHDTVEESSNQSVRLLIDGGITDMEICWAVHALTHYKGDTYMKYIERVSENKLAVKVKIADIYDNLTDAPSERQLEKYYQALQFLAGRV